MAGTWHNKTDDLMSGSKRGILVPRVIALKTSQSFPPIQGSTVSQEHKPEDHAFRGHLESKWDCSFAECVLSPMYSSQDRLRIPFTDVIRHYLVINIKSKQLSFAKNIQQCFQARIWGCGNTITHHQWRKWRNKTTPQIIKLLCQGSNLLSQILNLTILQFRSASTFVNRKQGRMYNTKVLRLLAPTKLESPSQTKHTFSQGSNAWTSCISREDSPTSSWQTSPSGYSPVSSWHCTCQGSHPA